MPGEGGLDGVDAQEGFVIAAVNWVVGMAGTSHGELEELLTGDDRLTVAVRLWAPG